MTDLSQQVKTLTAQLDGLLAQMMTTSHLTAALPSLLKRYSSPFFNCTDFPIALHAKLLAVASLIFSF